VGSGHSLLGTGSRLFNLVKEFVQIGAGKVSTGQHDALDFSRVVDVLQGVGIEQYEIGSFAFLKGTRVGQSEV